MKFQTNLNIHCRHVGAYTHKVRLRTHKSALRRLEVAVGALKKYHIYALRMKGEAGAASGGFAATGPDLAPSFPPPSPSFPRKRESSEVEAASGGSSRDMPLLKK